MHAMYFMRSLHHTHVFFVSEKEILYNNKKIQIKKVFLFEGHKSNVVEHIIQIASAYSRSVSFLICNISSKMITSVLFRKWVLSADRNKSNIIDLPKLSVICTRFLEVYSEVRI